MRILSNDDVKAVLDMPAAIATLREAYDELASGDAAYIPRIDLFAPTGRDDDYYQWGSMAGACQSRGVAAVRMKSDIVSWPAGATQEKYCGQPGRYCGLILVFRLSDGVPIALIQDGFLQHVRVGAAAGIGTDLLARPGADELGLIGSGGMAWSFLEAISQVRTLRAVRVYSPTAEHREDFAERARTQLGLRVSAVDDAHGAVAGTAIVATATDSLSPTFDAAWLAPGTHVTCVTRRELGSGLIERADVTMQLGEHTIPAGAEVPGMEWRAGAIASYVCGSPEQRERIPTVRTPERTQWPSLIDSLTGDGAGGRTHDSQVTVFVTTGTQGLQFASVGGMVAQRAAQEGLGHELPMDWFLEDIRN